MIKKNLGIFALTFLFIVGLTTQAEARHHCRKSTNIQLNVGAGYRTNTYVTRYSRPVILPAPVPVVPVYAPPAYYGPYAPVVAYPAPAYVEEVYVTPPPRSSFGLGLGGLSFSWNFFK